MVRISVLVGAVVLALSACNSADDQASGQNSWVPSVRNWSRCRSGLNAKNVNVPPGKMVTVSAISYPWLVRRHATTSAPWVFPCVPRYGVRSAL